MSKIPLIVVLGPTASGKTGLSIELSKSLGGEIVSADSMQIYKYMDIGTAKPTEEEQKEAVHHLIDIVEPQNPYSVKEYTDAAHKCIEEIIDRGKMPIMCGGTGLYIDSVVNDVSFNETESDETLREELREIANKEGNEKLIEILSEFDKKSAEKIHPNNLKRVIRAIEFYKLTGIPISEHQEKTKEKESRYQPVMIGIWHERELLYDRINKRVDIMINDGLIDEVKALKEMGLTADMQSMQGIGYKEILAHLNNGITIDEAISNIKQNSRNYAKRQLTWFRRNGRINWIDGKTDIVKKSKELINF